LGGKLFKKKKFLIGGLVIVLAIAYLAFSGFRSSALYLTVSEVKQQGSAIYEKNLRVNGKVVPESVRAETDKLTLEFTITEGNDSIPVVYHGVTPDTFRAGSDIVVEGQLDSQGVFQASSILSKCPSKYEPQQ
jgi:cytochrome c-type biogenesis protein CcmE